MSRVRGGAAQPRAEAGTWASPSPPFGVDAVRPSGRGLSPPERSAARPAGAVPSGTHRPARPPAPSPPAGRRPGHPGPRGTEEGGHAPGRPEPRLLLPSRTWAAAPRAQDKLLQTRRGGRRGLATPRRKRGTPQTTHVCRPTPGAGAAGVGGRALHPLLPAGDGCGVRTRRGGSGSSDPRPAPLGGAALTLQVLDADVADLPDELLALEPVPLRSRHGARAAGAGSLAAGARAARTRRGRRGAEEPGAAGAGGARAGRARSGRPRRGRAAGGRGAAVRAPGSRSLPLWGRGPRGRWEERRRRPVGPVSSPPVFVGGIVCVQTAVMRRGVPAPRL